MNLFKFFFGGCMLVVLFSGCSIEKRRYMHGFNIQWKNGNSAIKNQEYSNKKISENNQTTITEISNYPESCKGTFITSSEKSIIDVPVNFKSGILNRVKSEGCDTILLKNGKEISAKVVEISPVEIKYNNCGETNGLTYFLKRSEVFMIKYPNGTKDLLNQEEPVITNQNKKADQGVFGILSVLSVLLSPFFPLLLPAAIVFGAIGMGKRRKFKALAIVGFTLGIIGILIILIAIAFLLAFWV